MVASIFDAAMPIGMARLIAARLAAALEPELPLGTEAAGPPSTADGRAVTMGDPRRGSPNPRSLMGDPRQSPKPPGLAPLPGRVVVPVPPAAAGVSVRTASEHPPQTLTFGSALPRRSRPPPPPAELDRVSRLCAYLEAHAPEPHVVRCRLALRAGITLAALERPEALGPEAIVLIETAVRDILGIDRAELRRIA